MDSLKKIINLNQASKMSGYSQDYLGYLIRTGELKGEKVGRIWVTTKEEIQDYLFKQKIRKEKLPIRGFFSRRRTNNISLITITLFVGVFLIVSYVVNKNVASRESVNTKLSSEVEVIESIK